MPSYNIERALRDEGYAVICGVDEAGRGPLCGSVVAAACILPDGLEIPELNDSKKLTPKKRGCLIPGGIVDTERVSNLLIDEFRAAKIGRMTIDSLPAPKEAAPAPQPEVLAVKPETDA